MVLKGKVLPLALHPAYARRILWNLLVAKAKLVHICLQKMMPTLPAPGPLERKMIAGKYKTGSKLYQIGIWVWFSSFYNSTFIPDTYFMDEMVDYLVFEDYTNVVKS